MKNHHFLGQAERGSNSLIRLESAKHFKSCLVLKHASKMYRQTQFVFSLFPKHIFNKISNFISFSFHSMIFHFMITWSEIF